MICDPAGIRVSADFAPGCAAVAIGDLRSWSGAHRRSPVSVRLGISMDGKGDWRSIKYEAFMCALTQMFWRRTPQSSDISMASTMRQDPIRALTGRRKTRPISTGRSQSTLQHNHGKDPIKNYPELFKQTEPSLLSMNHNRFIGINVFPDWMLYSGRREYLQMRIWLANVHTYA